MSKIIVALSMGALITLACCGSCSYRIQGEWDPTEKSLKGAVLRGDRGDGSCTLPPETFQESDLVGTWIARYGGGVATDTLIINADSTYKQIFDDPIPGYHYESDWHKWWLEYGESGIPHLHMQRMHKCDGISERCRQPGGGGGNRPWFDFCEGRLIEMQGEVILLVTGVPERFTQPPRGIELWQLTGDPDTVGGVFHLQE